MYIALAGCPFEVVRPVVLGIEVDVVYYSIHIRIAVMDKYFRYKPMDVCLPSASVFQIHIQISMVVYMWSQNSSTLYKVSALAPLYFRVI